ncbi:MAG: trypsin-like peptidase domain-containing protein, partial [bacterium]|nr:trypsin-like peptidase domain-containing protein [bacterium]
MHRIAALPLALAGAASIALPAGAGAGTLADIERDVTAIVARSVPAVVQVIAERDPERGARRPFFHEGWGGPAAVSRSSGSGFFIDRDGHLLTTAHVVEGAGRVSVLAADGGERRAEVRGADRGLNIALLKVDGAPSAAL